MLKTIDRTNSIVESPGWKTALNTVQRQAAFVRELSELTQAKRSSEKWEIEVFRPYQQGSDAEKPYILLESVLRIQTIWVPVFAR